MTKKKVSNQRTSSVAARIASTGQFVVGERAFRKISAVEGIRLSKGLSKDLKESATWSADKRRSMLMDKYGSKKK